MDATQRALVRVSGPPELERTYFFRWWTYRKQLRRRVSWSPSSYPMDRAGKFNTISCAAGLIGSGASVVVVGWRPEDLIALKTRSVGKWIPFETAATGRSHGHAQAQRPELALQT